jgi:hypothetical protein
MTTSFVACLAVLLVLLAGSVAAQGDSSCVESESGFQVCDGFRIYWEQNNAQALIGQPLSDEFEEHDLTNDAARSVQYFELQRLELHPDNAGTPYAVMLGRLGEEVLAKHGRDWTSFPKDDPGVQNYQAVTGFAIAPEFIGFWQDHGIEFGDAGVSFRESLALFGYPITSAQPETDAIGEPVMIQWFERARFEYRNGEVVLGQLGVETIAVPGVADAETASTLAQVQRAVAQNGDLAVAQAAGWGLVDGLDHCFDNPGVGAMGVHYINVNLLDTSLDPLQPEAMVYQHASDGGLSLGAVEWIVPAEPWDAANPGSHPEVLGRMLHLNEALGVYVMHAWIFRENPSGVFEDWNPDVSCPS